jgi:membrane glycosyltransferase
MLKQHLDSIFPRAERKRGQIDPHLAVARAKIDDAETFEEAVDYLTMRETFAVLNDRRMLERMMTIAAGALLLGQGSLQTDADIVERRNAGMVDGSERGSTG